MPEKHDTVEQQATRMERLLPELARRLFTVDHDSPLSDLPVAQIRLCGLLQTGGRTMSQVGDELSISLSAVTQLADRLERAGLVERVAETDGDRRLKHLRLTAHGAALVAERQRLRQQRAARALTHLSDAERAATMAALEMLLDASRAVSDGERSRTGKDKEV